MVRAPGGKGHQEVCSFLALPTPQDLALKNTQSHQSNCIKVALKSLRIVVPELLGPLLLPEESNPRF